MLKNLSAFFRCLITVNFLWQLSFATEGKSLNEGTINYGIIRYIKGELLVKGKGEKSAKRAKVMDKFYDGSELSTNESSFAILKLPDGSTLKLDPKSNLKVEGLIEKKGHAFKGSSYFVLSVGGVMVDVVKKFAGPPSLEVETTNQVSFGVRGTTFYIFHDEETSDVWAAVKHGQVVAMDYMHDDSEVVKEGTAFALVEGQVMTKAHKYKWPERLNWSFTNKEESFDTKRVATADIRYKELQDIYKKLRKRDKKNFLKEKKSSEKSSGSQYRTPTEDYELNESGALNEENSGGNEAGQSGSETIQNQENVNNGKTPKDDGISIINSAAKEGAVSGSGVDNSGGPSNVTETTVDGNPGIVNPVIPTPTPSPSPTAMSIEIPPVDTGVTVNPVTGDKKPDPAMIPITNVTTNPVLAECQKQDPNAFTTSGSCPSTPGTISLLPYVDPAGNSHSCCLTITLDGNQIP